MQKFYFYFQFSKETILYWIGNFKDKIGYFIYLRKFCYLIFLKKGMDGENYCDSDFEFQLPVRQKF